MALQESHVHSQNVDAAQCQLLGARLGGVWSSGVSGNTGVAVIARASLRLRKTWESAVHCGRAICVQLYTGHSTLYVFVVYGYVHEPQRTDDLLRELHECMRENVPCGMPDCSSAGWRRVHAARLGTCFVSGKGETSIDAVLINGAAAKMLGRSWIDQEDVCIRPHRPLWAELRKSEHKIPQLLPPMTLPSEPPHPQHVVPVVFDDCATIDA
eukprot:5895628-Amphidinium_carterae.1